MYSIYGDGVCIHNDIALSKDRKVLSPKLTLTDNAAGSLEITVPPGNAGYSILERLSSEVIVYRDNEEIWSGRIISEKSDFWNRRVLTCEGELAYLNDTHQEPCKYTDTTTDDFLDAVLKAHNKKVDESKHFVKGAVTIHETMSATTNYETTIESINVNLIEKFGGHIRIRKENGIRYVDYLAEYINTNTQVIQFGKNLVDFVKNWDMTAYASVIIPRGARLEDSEIEGLEAYTTVESVNAGSIYVTSEEAIKERGWIEAVIDWEDITDPAELLSKAKSYITDTQFEEMIIEVSAVDLHYTAKEIEAMDLLDQIRCVSIPHGLDKHFPISQMTIPLDNPQNAKYTLGSTVKTTLTSSNKQSNSEIMKKIENLPSKETILKKASENATHLINMATNGFITTTRVSDNVYVSSKTYSKGSIVYYNGKYWEALRDTKGQYPRNSIYWTQVDIENVSEALIISDDADYTKATRMWKWNINGLGYSKDGGKTFPLAITMDGAIVADFITTGTLNANIIKAGILSDVNNNTTFNLSTGKLTIKKGEIKLGTQLASGNYPFQVDDDGYLHAIYGEIGAFTISDWGIYSNTMRLIDTGIRWYRDSVHLGNQGTNSWTDYDDYRGLVFDLENKAQYISWSVRENSTDDFYAVKLIYTKNRLTYNGETYRADRLNICCDSDFHNWTTYNFWFDPDNSGAVGGCSINSDYPVEVGDSNKYTKVLLPLKIDSSTGAVRAWAIGTIQNGVFMP